MRKITLSVFLCVLRFVCLSQEERQYAFVHYGPDKGLSGYEVRAIQQDKDGYIWLGTITALQRFDGCRFINFYHRKNDSSSIPDNHITQLIKDNKNNLWVVTASGHVGIFDTKKFTYKGVAVNPAKPNSLLCDKKLVVDSHGNIFLILFRNELLIYNEKNNSFSPANNYLPAKWAITSFCEQTTTGKYYIGSDSGLVVFNSHSKKLSYAGHNAENEPLIDQLGHIPHVAPMLLDSKHCLWIKAWTPTWPAPLFYRFDLHSNTVRLKDYSFLPLVKEYNNPLEMIEQKNGTIWARGEKLFARFIEKNKKFQLVHNGYVNELSIAFELIHDLKEDREQNLWIATNNNGLYRFNPSEQHFTNVHHENRDNHKPGEGSVLSFLPDNNGTLLMGAWSNGIYRFDSSLNNIPLNIQGIPENNTILVWNMHQSHDGHTVWMGTQGTQPGGLYRYDRVTQKAIHYEVPAVQRSTIRQIAEDLKGNLWIGTHTRGLFKCTKTANKIDFNKNVEKITAVDASTINAICIDSSGYIWVGTHTNGSYVIDPVDNHIVHHFTAGGAVGHTIQNKFVSAICVYNDTTVILATGGLEFYNTRTQKIKSMPWPTSFKFGIASMQRDRNGYLWISTSSGIFRYNIDIKNILIHFDRIDGIANDHFITAASASLPDGRLVFGCSDQFIAFNPQKIDLADPLPAVAVTGFKVRNKSLHVDSLLNLKFIELSPDQNAVTIDLSTLMYESASIIKYKLEGIDKDWVRTDRWNQAVYPYLPHGTYVFKAVAEDSEGKPGNHVTTLILKIKPHFWQTWWFFGLTVFAGLGVFLWVDKLRMQKIKATESVRSRIAQSLTEDMSNSLSSINITSELAKTKVDTDTERTKEYINQISDGSNRMVQAMYDMVWSINPGNDTLQHTIDRMKNYAVEMESQYSPSIIFQIDENAKDVSLSMEWRYEILSIFKEAVHNAARHAHAKYVEVSIRYKKPAISMYIRDDGKGFDLETFELSRGLTEMRRRANAINAKLIIKSEINTGTTVKLKIR